MDTDPAPLLVRKALSLWKAARYHYIPPSFLPALVAFAVAWSLTGVLDVPTVVLALIALVCNHAALNMTDDYFDYRHAVDRAKQGDVNPYTGGSRTLTSGELTPGEMLAAFIALYALTVALGCVVAYRQGWAVLLFGLIGLASSIFYTAPPVKYAYRGFGEVSLLLNFSLTIGLGAYFAQTGALSWETAAAVLPLGFMMFAMIVINEIPDEQDDRAGGKKNLVVRFGPVAGFRLFTLSVCLAYLLLTLGPLLGLTSGWTYLALATLPYAAKAVTTMRQNLRDPVALAPANLATIRAHNLMGLLLVVAYVVQGFPSHKGWAAPAVLLGASVLLYYPVALKVFRGAPRLRLRDPAG